jgi:hypothetical protein
MAEETASNEGAGLARSKEELEKIVETPITQEEAGLLISRIDMQKAQLSVIRLSLAERITSIDAQIAQADYDRSIVVHRALLGSKKGDAATEGKAD